ncbi:Isochorismatase hydrolase [Coniophora puteana RWD-64-598 SS2]|uniref:Isochorismatase hydrolase n=1 Tax=Coniophora puteana (strain RWD-64-598) TaxID=741705 RepID=A0A5M3MYF2_CONPW|nr:Isochorismatase hydrolase [Coniophora puteana RWD-64-598 SS2]EIW83641.1 Isochorismatase hydrolase [Coniophora puteana RWD-64-598 SS2]
MEAAAPVSHTSYPFPPDRAGTQTPEELSEVPERVLLILGAQEAPLGPPTNGGVPASAALRASIERVLRHARAPSADPAPRIIHIRHCGEPGDADAPGADGWAFVPALAPLAEEYVVDKRAPSAFAGTQLARLVPRQAEIIVVGVQTDFCVRATCAAALARGNEVFLIRGAHGTYDRREYACVENSGKIGRLGARVTPAEMVVREVEEELEDKGAVVLEMWDVPALFADRDR